MCFWFIGLSNDHGSFYMILITKVSFFRSQNKKLRILNGIHVFIFTAKKETAREKMLKEEERILESVAEKKGILHLYL